MSLVPDTDHLLMDAEHRTLLHWAMQAVGCLRESRAVDESFYAVDVLAHLSRSHFAHEEAEMEAARYPRHGFHCRDHEHLLASLAQLRGEIATGTRSHRGPSLAERLGNWMLAHIAGHDRHYALWLRRPAAGSRLRPPHPGRRPPGTV